MSRKTESRLAPIAPYHTARRARALVWVHVSYHLLFLRHVASATQTDASLCSRPSRPSPPPLPPSASSLLTPLFFSAPPSALSFCLLLRPACGYASSRRALPIFSTGLPAARTSSSCLLHGSPSRALRPSPAPPLFFNKKAVHFLLALAPCLSYTY